MAQKGHITLDGKEYLMELRAYQKGPANPMAAKVGTGAGSYDDLQDWSAWLMTDWRMGAGQREPEAGGFLYSEAETRFPQRLMLPPQQQMRALVSVRYPGDLYSSPDISANLITISAGQYLTYEFTPWMTIYGAPLWVFVGGGDDLYEVVIWKDAGGGSWSAIYYSGGISRDDDYPGWLRVAGTSTNLSSGVKHRIGIGPAGSASVSVPVAPASGSAYMYQNGNWSSSSDGILFLMSSATMRVATKGDGEELGAQFVVRLGGQVYIASGDGLYWYHAANVDPTTTGNYSGVAITSMVTFDDYVHFALDDGRYEIMKDGIISSVSGVTANLFARWNGYLYRTDGNNLYYTNATGGTWSGPYQVTDDPMKIRGMAGMGPDLYISTDDGLYKFTGSAVVAMTPWPSVSDKNGQGMINWMGDLYIPLSSGLIRVTSSGQILQMGLDRGEGLPSSRVGRVRSMTATTNWLVVAVDPESDTGTPTIWAWNEEGWHHLANCPVGTRVGAIYFDRQLENLFVGLRIPGKGAFYFFLPLSDKADNPLKDSTQKFTQFGWIEFPTFYGGLKEVQKDFESVYVTGENLSSTSFVSVYWQDDDSTDWEYLGDVKAPGTELRWSDKSTRPNTKGLRLALLLRTSDSSMTPSIEAVRVKYHPMVTDRWRWNLVLRVADNLEMLDGSMNDRTADEMRSDLEAAIRSVPPVTFVDLDGQSYDVKIEAGSETVGRYEVLTSGDVQYESHMQLTLREV